jgi:hypothetical protein
MVTIVPLFRATESHKRKGTELVKQYLEANCLRLDLLRFEWAVPIAGLPAECVIALQALLSTDRIEQCAGLHRRGLL